MTDTDSQIIAIIQASIQDTLTNSGSPYYIVGGYDEPLSWRFEGTIVPQTVATAVLNKLKLQGVICSLGMVVTNTVATVSNSVSGVRS